MASPGDFETSYTYIHSYTRGIEMKTLVPHATMDKENLT